LDDIDFDELNKIGEDWERQVSGQTHSNASADEPDIPQDASLPQEATEEA